VACWGWASFKLEDLLRKKERRTQQLEVVRDQGNLGGCQSSRNWRKTLEAISTWARDIVRPGWESASASGDAGVRGYKSRVIKFPRSPLASNSLQVGKVTVNTEHSFPLPIESAFQ
jgi:hypothetical protein